MTDHITKKKSKTKKLAKRKDCGCLKQVNAELKKLRGAVLATELAINFTTSEISVSDPKLAVERYGDQKGNLPTVLCTYCPFCGKKKP